MYAKTLLYFQDYIYEIANVGAQLSFSIPSPSLYKYEYLLVRWHAATEMAHSKCIKIIISYISVVLANFSLAFSANFCIRWQP